MARRGPSVSIIYTHHYYLTLSITHNTLTIQHHISTDHITPFTIQREAKISMQWGALVRSRATTSRGEDKNS